MLTSYDNLSIKSTLLWQRRCQICVLKGKISLFSIRISPKSFRNQDVKVRKAFYCAIKSRLGTDHVDEWSGKRLCVALTFVIKNGSTEKDIDNMSKILLDALHKVFYENDRAVDHLDAVKIRTDDSEEFVLLRIMETDLNEHNDVNDKTFKHGWGGQQPINLSDYMGTKEKI